MFLDSAAEDSETGSVWSSLQSPDTVFSKMGPQSLWNPDCFSRVADLLAAGSCSTVPKQWGVTLGKQFVLIM